MQLSLNKVLARFPRPNGLKGIIYDQGLQEIQTTILKLPDADIEEIARDLTLIWSVKQ